MNEMTLHPATSPRALSTILFSSLLILLSGMTLAVSAMPLDSLKGENSSPPWSFSVAGYYYVIPDDDDFMYGVGTADRGSLHLEGRYNYEGPKTGSLFAGWKISAGETFTIEVTPMVGVAFGQTFGIIPALEMSLGYGIFDFYDESEYLIDLGDKESSFFYSWLELGVSPSDLFRCGLAAQRMRVVQSPLEIDRGLFLQVNPAPTSLTVYALNPFTEYWLVLVGAKIAW
jgi:hypothetical protein